ncbi:thiol reductant ABC exporter subunit CydD [Nesterenkonia xinjiangensis]|uniref:ATP-binding cassette subfamily C protein CydD n=1 Tax=Nesterenkonia xinjiangensis TaxID=225327 RepID=A0A7Z0K9T6_9MICC|nr:thiol reductant ABC exporter subunit CydD [Nesterenkonia xinjiangensis]NYJ78108.1 ATP-binding cassette subfamily C protein CydD [Nesterenkonia xinjiangensis]
MKPLDPRLLHHARAARGFLALSVALGLVQVLLVLAFSALLAGVLATVIAAVGVLPGDWVSEELVVQEPASGVELLGLVAPLLGGLAAVAAARAGVSWVMEWVAARAAARVKSQLRRQAAEALVHRGLHDDDDGAGPAHAVSVLGSGLDALDAYFSRYLPQLVLTALAVPILLGVLATQDLTTAVIVVVTMPLVPVFMVLVGWSTQSAQLRQRRRLDRLGTAYLDLVEGLSTLKIFNRQNRQRQNLHRLTEQHRSATMKVLRVSFLSGFVLELAASLSVALVAVSVGVRLIDGELGLFVGLFVLLIVPEAYAPLRQVGAQYHAAADGIAASEEVFALLESEPRTVPTGPGQATLLRRSELRLRGVGVARGGSAIVDDVDLTASPGRITALAGPSGSGKSTLAAAVVGLVAHTGEITLSGEEGSRPITRDDVAWAGQRHGLRSGTVGENIALGEPQLHSGEARSILDALDLPELPLDHPLGVRGAGLSGGQAHRIAVARAVHRARARNAPVLLLDEPSAALDETTEQALIGLLRAEADAGRTVLVISHRPGVLESADVVHSLEGVR